VLFVLTACEIIPTKSIDDAINEIDRVRQTVAGESSAWRDELPKLTRTLQGLESQVNADIKGVVADAVRGSLAMPYVFPPHQTAERLLVDGYLSDPLPVDR